MKDKQTQYNASQREAILHRDGPALVLAGPGSGKTTVITKRLQTLIETKAALPQEIAVITFTKAAALQMQQRFFELAKGSLPVRFGTFHSFYYHILQEHQVSDSQKLLTEQEKRAYIRQILRKRGLSEELAPHFLEQIEKLKNGEEVKEVEILSVFEAYRRLCRERGRLDFDDMAYECLRLLSEQKEIRQLWQKRLKYFLVDEYQDIAPIQERLLELLAQPQNNLFLVGDDDQAIYGFRGAGPESMLTFPKRYADTKKIILETNYRSTPEIISAAGRVIQENKERFAKKQIPVKASGGRESFCCRAFAGRDEQLNHITEQLLQIKQQRRLSECAILYRKHADAKPLLAALDKRGIPYVQEGRRKSWLGHFVTEDVTAYLRFFAGNRERGNFYRIMNRPMRRIERAGCRERICFSELCRYHLYDYHIVKEIKKLEADCLRVAKMPPFAALMYLRKAMGYEKYLTQEYAGAQKEEAFLILEKLQEFSKSIADISLWESSLEAEKCRMDKPGQTEMQEQNGVHIMTYHAAKGLEFDTVILPDLNEKILPHKRAATEQEIEEERRLFYVGMTRAKERLYLYYCTGTKEEPETMSRFLKPLVNG